MVWAEEEGGSVRSWVVGRVEVRSETREANLGRAGFFLQCLRPRGTMSMLMMHTSQCLISPILYPTCPLLKTRAVTTFCMYRVRFSLFSAIYFTIP